MSSSESIIHFSGSHSDPEIDPRKVKHEEIENYPQSSKDKTTLKETRDKIRNFLIGDSKEQHPLMDNRHLQLYREIIYEYNKLMDYSSKRDEHKSQTDEMRKMSVEGLETDEMLIHADELDFYLNELTGLQLEKLNRITQDATTEDSEIDQQNLRNEVLRPN